jgi:hypothetical protein
LYYIGTPSNWPFDICFNVIDILKLSGEKEIESGIRVKKYQNKYQIGDSNVHRTQPPTH